MSITMKMSKDAILDFVYRVDEGNWLERQPPVTANAPVCACGCGEPYLYDASHGWEVFCARD